MLMGEIFTDNIEMERVLVNGMDNLCRKLGLRSFQFVVLWFRLSGWWCWPKASLLFLDLNVA